MAVLALTICLRRKFSTKRAVVYAQAFRPCGITTLSVQGLSKVNLRRAAKRRPLTRCDAQGASKPSRKIRGDPGFQI